MLHHLKLSIPFILLAGCAPDITDVTSDLMPAQEAFMEVMPPPSDESAVMRECGVLVDSTMQDAAVMDEQGAKDVLGLIYTLGDAPDDAPFNYLYTPVANIDGRENFDFSVDVYGPDETFLYRYIEGSDEFSVNVERGIGVSGKWKYNSIIEISCYNLFNVSLQVSTDVNEAATETLLSLDTTSEARLGQRAETIECKFREYEFIGIEGSVNIDPKLVNMSVKAQGKIYAKSESIDTYRRTKLCMYQIQEHQ